MEVQRKLDYINESENGKQPESIDKVIIKQIKYYNDLMVKKGYPEDQIYLKYCGDI